MMRGILDSARRCRPDGRIPDRRGAHAAFAAPSG